MKSARINSRPELPSAWAAATSPGRLSDGCEASSVRYASLRSRYRTIVPFTSAAWSGVVLSRVPQSVAAQGPSTRGALAKNTHRGRGVGGQPDRGRIEQARLRRVDRGSGQVLEAVSEREVDEPASGGVHRGGHARSPSVASCKRRALQLAAAKSKA